MIGYVDSRQYKPLKQVVLEVIRDMLIECKGNQTLAAKRLKISRGCLRQNMQLYTNLIDRGCVCES